MNFPINLEEAVANGFMEPILEMAQGDMKFVHKMVATFQKSTVLELTEIESVLASDNVTTCQKLAHKFKSSFQIFQMKVSSTICVKIEQEESIVEVRRLFGELRKQSDFYNNLLIKELDLVFPIKN